MKKITFYILCFLGGMGILLSGCSSSSGSLRYKSDSKNTSEKKSTVRFSSENKVESADSIILSGDEYLSEEDEEDEDFPENEPAIDLSEVMSRYSSKSPSNSIEADNSTEKEKILMEIIKYLNTPYKFGGNSKNGIDCSAFTQTIYRNTLNIPLLRTARDQYTMGIIIENRNNLEFGDLVFFNTRRRVRPGHVGIYIGDNLFAHASSKHGVIVSSLDHEYYSKKYMGGRRIEGFFNVGL